MLVAVAASKQMHRLSQWLSHTNNLLGFRSDGKACSVALHKQAGELVSLFEGNAFGVK